jgi:hypothetical protein
MNTEKKRLLKSLQEISGVGTKLEESKKSIEKKDKLFFLELIHDLEIILNNTNDLMERGIDLSVYEDQYFKIIEQVICKHYGEASGVLMFWWVNTKIMSPTLPRTVKLADESEYKINTPHQLWDFIKIYNKKYA